MDANEGGQMGAGETMGEKLQLLVDAGLDLDALKALTSAQKEAIEALNWSQLHGILEAHSEVGPVFCSNFI